MSGQGKPFALLEQQRNSTWTESLKDLNSRRTLNDQQLMKCLKKEQKLLQSLLSLQQKSSNNNFQTLLKQFCLEGTFAVYKHRVYRTSIPIVFLEECLELLILVYNHVRDQITQVDWLGFEKKTVVLKFQLLYHSYVLEKYANKHGNIQIIARSAWQKACLPWHRYYLNCVWFHVNFVSFFESDKSDAIVHDLKKALDIFYKKKRYKSEKKFRKELSSKLNGYYSNLAEAMSNKEPYKTEPEGEEFEKEKPINRAILIRKLAAVEVSDEILEEVKKKENCGTRGLKRRKLSSSDRSLCLPSSNDSDDSSESGDELATKISSTGKGYPGKGYPGKGYPGKGYPGGEHDNEDESDGSSTSSS